MEPTRFQLTYHLPAPPEQVWPILADTDRLNRKIGLPRTQPQAIGREPICLKQVKARMAGMGLVWEEIPFDWVEGRYYWVRRLIHNGPIEEFSGGVRFLPSDEGTDIRVEAELTPRNAIGSSIIRAMGLNMRRQWDRMIPEIIEHLEGRQATPYGLGIDLAAAGVRDATLQRLRAGGKEFLHDPLAERLCEYLAEAGDAELVRIRPFLLARRWKAERYDVLRLCLQAASDQVLDLSWDLLCPNCGGAKNRWRHLDEVRSRSHCDDCQIHFDANFDRAVEVTFRPTGAIREIDASIYCSGGPRNTPHVVAQVVLEPDTCKTVDVPLAPGRYRLRNLRGDRCEWLVAEEGALPTGVLACFESGGLSLSPPEPRVCSGMVRLSLENLGPERLQALVERATSFEDCATAAVVSAYQEFRDLFGSEVLSPDTQLGIRCLPLMFTDLQGSTALYRRLGDTTAYVLIRDHFALLRSVVARHGGGVVKTIGDSVMAAFPTAAAAMACALEVHRELHRFSERFAEPLSLKVGLHQGPCIAVGVDDHLDYFGGTVNLAARTHEVSSGKDVVVTEAILRDPTVAALLAGITQTAFVADLQGIGETRLFRLDPAPHEIAAPGMSAPAVAGSNG